MASESRMNMAITGSVGHGGHVSLLVATVADLLETHIQSGHLPDSSEFSNLCLSLARGIDYAIANNEIPVRARDLPLLLKKVLRHMNDSSLQAVFVLMISVKNACKIGWFPDHDANGLLTLAKEIGKNFATMEDINVQPSYLLNVRKIMLRYYPRIRMGHMLASLDIKPGSGAFVVDFHMTKSMLSPAQKCICLFVAQTDNMDTSSCIVLPPQANFLLNGKGVRGRINSSMDNGPQLPINVTAMLKYGKNLLQVVGQFNGNYVIVIAFMSMISTSNTPELQDYIQPVAVTSDSDLEVIEGQARISLNCPISFKRIKIPVKGHLCKHHQCFDYGNFMEINLRRPSWRCPHCNQPVCNPDIRIDQKMVKVLKEVEENVVDVIISPDGSWKTVAESIDHETQSNQQEHSEQCKSVGFSNIPAQVVDLTMGEDDEDECPSSLGTEDMKSLSYNLQGLSAAEIVLPAGVNYMVEADQSASAQTEDHVWSAEQFPTSSVSNGFVLPTMSSNAQRNFGSSRTPSSFMSSHVLTDAISPSLWETSGVHGETQMPISTLQNQYFGAGNSEVQQTRFGSLSASNEYGMVGLPNLGAAQVINKSRNIVHPSIRIQPGKIQQRRGSIQVTGATGGERAHMSSILPPMPVQLQPARTGTRFSYAMVAEQLRTAAEEERQNTMGRTGMVVEQLGTAWSLPGADALAENWQPPGTMGGSLTGEADSAAISRFMLQSPTNPPSTLESGLPAFWPFPSSSNDHNGMYSQSETQGRLRSNWAGTGSSGSFTRMDSMDAVLDWISRSKMRRTFTSLARSLPQARGFCTSTSEKVVASVLFERLPVVVPKIDPVVYAFQEFSFRWRQQYRRKYPDEIFKRSEERGKGDYQIDYVPASRVTEADKNNDRRSLQRALDRRLYLLLYGTTYGAPDGKPIWHFPEKVYGSEETLRKCAESALESVIGDLSHTYFVGNAPFAHMVIQPTENGPDLPSFKRFFFKSQVIATNKYNIGKCKDHVWVTKDELLEYFPEQAEFLNKMIIG